MTSTVDWLLWAILNGLAQVVVGGPEAVGEVAVAACTGAILAAVLGTAVVAREGSTA